MENEDVVTIELTPEEKNILAARRGEEVKPKTTDEPPAKTDADPEPPKPKEGEETAKKEDAQPEKVEKPKKEKDLIGELFEIGKKKKEPVSDEPLAENEREEYLKLKAETAERKEQEAFKTVLADYPEEVIDILKTTIAALIEKDSALYDEMLKNDKITPEQRAITIVALAEKRHKGDLEKLSQKAVEGKIEAAKKEAELKKEVKEIASVKVAKNEPPETAAEKHKKTWDAAESGDDDALNDILLSDETKTLERFKR